MKTFDTAALAGVTVVVLMAAATVRGADVTLAWEAPMTTVAGAPLEGLAGYRLAYGTAAGEYEATVDVGDVTSATLRGLDEHRAYYIAVKAVTADGEESNFSEEIVWTHDADQDALSDAWEVQHFGRVDLALADGTTDYDGDGISNLGEYVAGTDPADAGSRAMLVLDTNGEALTVAFATEPASGLGFAGRTRHYRLERCDDLSSGLWTPVAGFESVPGDGRTVTCVLPNSVAGSAYFRTEIRLE